MAYRHVEMGKLIKSDPTQAAQVLGDMFEQYLGMNPVAAALEVNRTTLHRWCEFLFTEGYGDPRERALEAQKGPRDSRAVGTSLCVPKSVAGGSTPSRRRPRAVVPLPPLRNSRA